MVANVIDDYFAKPE